MLEMFGFDEFINSKDFIKLLFRLGLDLVFALVIVKGVYSDVHKRRDYAFTFLLLNVITFSLCFLLRKVPMELGFALGLFAVFGVLRFRTEPIRTRDLTYLFVVIGIAILNAVANKKVSFAELVLINSVIVGLAAFLEYSPFSKGGVARTIVYDNLALLTPGNQEALLADIRERTGLDAQSVSVGDVDLLRDSARITVICGQRPTGTTGAAARQDADEITGPVAGGVTS